MKHSHCEAAIGILTVKKTTDGLYMLFCHNTDSFVSQEFPLQKDQKTDRCHSVLQAIASMTSEDKAPHCVMSRRSRHGTTAQGGRLFRVQR